MRGQGRLFLRGRVYWIAYYHRGEEIRESANSEREGDARRLLRERLRTAGTTAFTDPKVERVTFDELAEAYLRDYRINGKRSVRDADRSVRHLATMFGDMRACDIDADRIETYKDARLAERSPTGTPIRPATVNRELAALRRMFSLACKTRPGFRHRPHIALLAENNTREGFADPALFDAIVHELRQRDADVADVAEFAYQAAWRRGEVLTLQWSDVEWRAPDHSAAVLQLRRAHSKNKQPRVLPLSDELLAIVQHRWTLRRLDCPYIFHRSGRPIRDFRTSWRKACKAAGVTAGRAGLVFHDLRRSGVRNMRRAGVPEGVAMKISGHRTRAVFDRYNIVSEDDIAEAVERVSAHVAREREASPPVVPLHRPMRTA
jgi:integrase